MTTSLERSVERPAWRWTASHVAMSALGVSAALVASAGMLAGLALGLAPAAVEAPSWPALPAMPPPAVLTQLVAVPVPAVADEPTEDPEAPPPGPPRATTPLVNGDCLLVGDDVPVPPSCGWDDGLPALSGDGRRVARWLHDDDPGGEPAGLSLQLLDARTSRPLRTLRLVSTDERRALDEHGAVPARVRAAVARRAAAAQQLLDAGGYRTLVFLGSHPAYGGGSHDDERHDGVYVEVDGALVRAIEPTTREVVWQRRFDVPDPTPGEDADEECGGWSLAESSVWWAPPTHTVLVEQVYHHGGCMCGSTTVQHVVRFR